MRQDMMLKLASLMTAIVWLIVLIVNLDLRSKKKKILHARSTADMGDFDCTTVGARINFTKIVHRVNIIGFGVISLLLIASIISRALLYFGAGAISKLNFGETLLHLLNPSVSVAWLFCLGAWTATKSFVKFYMLLAQKCKEMLVD